MNRQEMCVRPSVLRRSSADGWILAGYTPNAHFRTFMYLFREATLVKTNLEL